MYLDCTEHMFKTSDRKMYVVKENKLFHIKMGNLCECIYKEEDIVRILQSFHNSLESGMHTGKNVVIKCSLVYPREADFERLFVSIIIKSTKNFL